VIPYIGSVRLDQLTGSRLTALYRSLEMSGRADGDGGLAPRTVRYVHTIIHAGLKAAVRDGSLAINPADKAVPPTARESVSPEMHTWTSDELRGFLDWSESRSDEMYVAWLVLAMTGMRRGEALALRWGDVDFATGTVSVRRSAGRIVSKGLPERIVVDLTKTGKSRVIDLDEKTATTLRAYRAQMGSISLSLARPESYILGDLDGAVRHPERFRRTFLNRVSAARKSLGEENLSELRMHDLRHTHATLLLQAGVPVKVVSERLGHANATTTLGIYAHVMPGMQREAASKFAGLVYGSSNG
jgi:integrase